MASMMADNSSETNELLEAASEGNTEIWGALLARHRDRLCRMAALRMDRRLQGRIDPSDVIQEACMEASQRFSDYRKNSSMPFFVWLRFLTGQKHCYTLETLCSISGSAAWDSTGGLGS
jgi:RNA polymerase sigma-70 factor (ECF subfamily)